MRLILIHTASTWRHIVSLSFLVFLGLSVFAQNGCEDDAGNFYGPYEELVVSDDPCENFTCIPSAFSFVWVSNAEFLDDCGEDEEDEDGLDEEDWEALIEWLEELCADGMPNDWGIDPDMACGILELIAACDNGSEEACEELESIWEELEDFWDEDDEEDEEDDEEDGEEDDEEDDDFDEEDWEALIEWLEELCADGMPNDWGIDPDMACGILELIAACDNGSEEACEELESIWEEFEDFWDEEDDEVEDCEVDFEFEQALDEDGVPLPYNIVAYVDEPEADTYYFWTFGDGNESDEPNPTHVYDEVGNYEVCLTVTLMDGNMLECTATYCDTLMIDMDGLVRQQMILNILFPGQTVNAVAEHEMALEVHPNPAADVVRIRVEGGIESAVVQTMDGRLVGRWASHGSQVLELSSAAWPTGSYMVVVKTATGVQRSRLLVQH